MVPYQRFYIHLTVVRVTRYLISGGQLTIVLVYMGGCECWVQGARAQPRRACPLLFSLTRPSLSMTSFALKRFGIQPAKNTLPVLPYEIWVHVASFIPLDQVKGLMQIHRAFFDLA